MAKTTWSLEQLKTELSKRKEIKNWTILQEYIHRRERYFMMDRDTLVVDQDRDVRIQNIQVKLATRLLKTGRQGEVTKKLFQSLSLGPQVDSAIQAANETDHQAWDLPVTPPQDVPHRATADPAIAEDLERAITELTTEVETVVTQKRPTLFNSAELFLSVYDRELHLSNGLIHRSAQTRAYAESAYSMNGTQDGKPVSDEYLNTRWSVSRSDLGLAELFQETSDRAQVSLGTIRPTTGKYSVIIDAEVLGTLLNGHLGQLSGTNSYHGLPFVKPGDLLIPGAEGDLLTLTLDPSTEYGADTLGISEQGLVQKPLKLVDRNRVMTTATDKQFADYLGTQATTVCGNVVVEPGTLTHEELTRQSPIVFEILQFSGLFADFNSGTFSSEIRLAKLYDNTRGQVRYVKGGSLSGSITENFKGLRLSNKKIKRAQFSANQARGHGYFGPEHALLSDVSIVGDSE